MNVFVDYEYEGEHFKEVVNIPMLEITNKLLNARVKPALVPHPSHQTHRPKPTVERPLIPLNNSPIALILRQAQTNDADLVSHIGAALPHPNKTQFRLCGAQLDFAHALILYQIVYPKPL